MNGKAAEQCKATTYIEILPDPLEVWTGASIFPLQLCGKINLVEVNKCGRRLLLEHLLEVYSEMAHSKSVFLVLCFTEMSCSLSPGACVDGSLTSTCEGSLGSSWEESIWIKVSSFGLEGSGGRAGVGGEQG